MHPSVLVAFLLPSVAPSAHSIPDHRQPCWPLMSGIRIPSWRQAQAEESQFLTVTFSLALSGKILCDYLFIVYLGPTGMSAP